MNPFRARWPDRLGLILAAAAASVGFTLVRPLPVWPGGELLLAWTVATLLVAVPMLVVELATGAIYQSAAADSLRKANKQLEVLGWGSAALALAGAVLIAGAAAGAALAGWDSAIAALAGQPLPWAPNAERVLAERPHEGGLVLAVAALFALVHLRLRRGAPGIARTALTLGLAGAAALVVAAALLLTRPGAVEGLARLLAPSADPWGTLGSWALWQEAIGLALAAWLPGLGIYTAFGSCLNRSSDVTGLGVVAGLIGALAVLLLTAVAFAAGGVATVGGQAVVGQAGGPPLLMAVPEALVQLPFLPWFIAALATLWFALVLAFLIPALVALVEAVTAPVVDKFHLPRERVVPGVCLVAFFLAALLALGDGAAAAALTGPLITLVAVLVALHALATWRALTLEALQRHLNAYSAFRLGPVWRVSVSLLVPVAVLAFAIARWADEAHPLWLAGATALVAALAVTAARLPARSA